MALDKSTDRVDLSQLIVFVTTVNQDFKVHKEMLRCCLDFDCLSILSGIYTVGAPFMEDENQSLVEILKKYNTEPMTMHFIICTIRAFLSGPKVYNLIV